MPTNLATAPDYVLPPQADFAALLPLFEDSLRMANYSPQSVESFATRLTPFVAWSQRQGLLVPGQVAAADLERYRQSLFSYRRPNGSPLAFTTQALRLGAVKLLFKWLVRRGYLAYSPAADLEYPKAGTRLPRTVLSHAEVERVLRRADVTTPLGLRDRTVLEVLYCTGMRRMELAGLQLGDLRRDARTLFIRRAKGDKQRVVPLGERTLAWLRRYLREARPKLAGRPETALFLDKHGAPLSKRAVSTIGKKMLRRAKLGKAGAAHVFRHSAATAMLEGGADIRFVQELLGHASLLSTQVYTRVAISALKVVHAATHPGAPLRQDPASAKGTRRRTPCAKATRRRR